MNLIKALAQIFLVIIIIGDVSAQRSDQQELSNKLDLYLKAIHLKKGFSGEVLVAKKDNVLFHKASGFTSLENNLKLEVGATYRIASVTKTFTASLIALAQEANYLSYNDKADKYVKGLADKFKDITIHQLLTHTSGLPHNEAIEDYWQVKSKLQLSTENVVDEINKVDLLFAPGTDMHYSSLGYYLLAVILENVYKKTHQDILEAEILSPLDIEGSGVANGINIIPRMASGYHQLNDDSLVQAPYRNYSLLKGAGDMYSTASDLLKWTNSFVSSQLLKKHSMEQIFKLQQEVGSSGKKLYGYGWFIDTDCPKKYFHGGGTWGYSSYLALYPEEEINIIVLSNISVLPVESIANDIEKIVFGLPFTMPETETIVLRDSLDLKIYSGSFISESGKGKLDIMSSKEGLFAQLSGNPAFQIYPKGKHQFFGKKVEVVISFEVNNSIVTGLTAERMGQKFYFKKL